MNSKAYISLLFTTILVVFLGCKSAKTITGNGELNSNLSTKQIVKNTNKAKSNFNTIVGKLKIEYTEKEKTDGITVSFRMEKDKVIWMSKLGIAKVLITPDKVAFYNKWDRTYFDGDFAYLSDLLGTDIDFTKLQNLLIGESIFALNDKDYKASIHEKSYVLQPKKQRDLFEVFLLLNPSHFKMDSQQIWQPQEKRMLEIDYLAYQKVDNLTLPEKTKILAVEKDDQLEINLEFKSLVLNEKLRFPFKIPSGYDEIKLD